MPRCFAASAFVAVADLNMEAARIKGAKYDLPAVTPRELLRARRYRHRAQPDGTGRPCRGVACGDRGRQARLHRKAARHFAERRQGDHEGGGAQGRYGRCRSRHGPRRRRPDGARHDRSAANRRHRDRHRHRPVAWHGELASQSGFLLQAGRRAGARHGALLSLGTRQSSGSDRKRRRHRQDGLQTPHRHVGRPDEGQAHQGRNLDDRERASFLCKRCRHRPAGELGCLAT